MSQTSFSSPLVGREDELARLGAALERARGGEARAVLVAGDAGVGKTRTLDEVSGRAAAAGATVLTGHCVDLGDVGLPYLPFTEILGQAAADERFAAVLTAHPVAERLLGGGPEDDGGAPRSRLLLFEGVAALLTELADAAPLLLVLEDLHWADQSSRDLLRFLLSRGVLQRHRITVFASYRADDLHRRHPLRPLLAELVRLPAVERLELRPLPDADVATLVRALRQRPLPDTTVHRIVARAEGNAFYAEELVAATDAPAAGGVPSGLADVLLIRFEQLTETAQQVLRTAAVAGRRVGHDLLRDAVGLPEDELEAALREAVERQLLVSGDGITYSFRHALAREAVYADLLPGERARLHGAFARLLAGPDRRSDSAAERAHHYRESHDLPDALAASLEAADHAQRVGAPAEELRHLEAVLDLWSSVAPDARPAGPDAVTLTLRASAAAAHAGELHRAVSLTRSALAGLGQDADLELAARVRYTLAGNLLSVDNLTAAYTHSSEALDLIPAEPPSSTWVWAAATHVMAARQVGENETGLRVARRALRVAHELGVADARADLLISLTSLEGANRATPAGRERLLEARDLARRAGNAPVEMRALFNLAIGCFESGDLEDCLHWATEGLDRARRAGLLSSPYPREMRYLRLLVRYTLGQWDEVLRESAEEAGVRSPVEGHALGPALYVTLARGDVGAAERAARSMLEGPFDWMARMVGGLVLTDAAVLRGDAEDAVRWTRSSVEALTEAGERPTVTLRYATLALSAVADRVTGLRRAGDEAAVARWTRTASDLLEEARWSAAHGYDDRPQGQEGQAWLARAEAEWSRVSSPAPDPAAWERAVAAFAQGDPYERARCRLRWAEALLAADRREEAAAEADAVRREADRLGAVPLRERLDDLARRGRLTGAPAPSAAPGAAVLTAREQDVLRLLALGRSNRQIGEELFISAKTASVHVSNILAKLGAAGRTEAVAVAYRQGLIAPEATASG